MPAGVFGRLLGAGFACAERRDSDGPMHVHPQEVQAVGRAVPRRRQEFLLGRTCARLALRELGVADQPLLPGPHRAPRWPSGIVGSITHTEGYCAAVAARSAQVASVGIDAQAVRALSPSLWPRLFVAAELDRLAALPVHRQTVAAGLLFSAKEAVFKCQHPLTGRMLSFLDVAIHPDEGGFAVCREAALPTMSGVWAVEGPLAFACAVAPPSALVVAGAAQGRETAPPRAKPRGVVGQALRH